MNQSGDSTMTFAGIDGGGTRTRLVLTRGDGCLIGFAESGCCSFVELGKERAREAFDQLWQSAWRSAKSPARPADAVFIGTGSILSPADARVNCELALSLGWTQPGNLHADNDACNALAGALEGRPGLLVISGTGSVCLGRNARRETWRAGGWGHLLNDAGSAHALSFAAMIAATRAADGRGHATALSAVVLEALALRDLKEIYRKLHEAGTSRAEIAALAPRVIALAETGDKVANGILDQGADGLVEMVMAVADRLGFSRPELALSGGLINHTNSYRERFLARLDARLPGFTLANDGFAPVLGAIMLACQNVTNHPPSEQFLENLRRTAAKFNLKA